MYQVGSGPDAKLTPWYFHTVAITVLIYSNNILHLLLVATVVFSNAPAG